MRERPRQTNCQQEPNFPAHETVTHSLAYPDLVCHRVKSTSRCDIHEPHRLAICAEFDHGEQYNAIIEAARVMRGLWTARRE